jgi:hypothetical protein
MAAEAQLAKQRGEGGGQLSLFTLGGIDLADVGTWPPYQIVLTFLVLVLGAIYASFTAAGAVKMQNLSSLRWGKAGCLLAMTPINSGGMAMVLDVVCEALLTIFGLKDVYPTESLVLVFVAVAWLASLLTGLLALKALNRPDVVAGFKYRGE